MMITGTPVCPGKVLCKTKILKAMPHFDLELQSEEAFEEARSRVWSAIEAVSAQLAHTAGKMPEREAEMIDVQRTMLEEEGFLEEIERFLMQGSAPEAAVLKAAKVQEELLLALEDEYLSARAEDIHDVSHRVACLLAEVPYPDISLLEEKVILIAQELLPSMLMSADLKNLSGIILQKGTPTSHVSILASSLNIPALVACSRALELPENRLIFLDSVEGKVVYGAASFKEERRQAEAYAQEQALLKDYCGKSAITANGQTLLVAANIIEPSVLSSVKEQGLDGVGLFRTEFLYMNRASPPGEEEQLAVYCRAAQMLEGKPLTIRTMDIGGDKEVDYLGIPHEENPFLGFRAIRICLDRTELFKTQLRAVLRASSEGSIRLMFPMIATKEELTEALELLEECRQELRWERLPFDTNMPVGMMVEVPSAAIMLDTMAPLIRFVSIGSNDLLQYTFAADRLNPKVGYLYNCMHPAMLRLLGHIIGVCRQAEIECSLCGEMAGDALGLAALAALGLRKFSVSPALGLVTKKRIHLLNLGRLEKAGRQMLGSESAEQAAAVLKEALPNDYPAL
ncbi:phosphoenolpyruvate--protein phosphotransferase [Oscillospiraceae bacterium MB08-C2-2]|nr:phosphoenolpyruvate--protein phosphotransferase [Oscillospiraceae bacterium MB08-C2-2]